MKLLKSIVHIILIALLTLITQVGGLFYLIALILRPLVLKRLKGKHRKLVLLGLFLICYAFGSFLLVPRLAKSFGREALPIYSSENLKPLTIMTCILNRHYVNTRLKNSLQNVAHKMEKKHPNTVISYLDANFPFYNGFPLLPHLSHNDGKKVDLAFFYKDKDGEELNKTAPSYMGYGVYEAPKKDEYNTPENCENKGYWQYSFLEKIVPQWNKDNMLFDQKRTKSLIQFLLRENSTQKIFIEPHLKGRMRLTNTKVRFHGCGAVRHDDHIHLQIR